MYFCSQGGRLDGEDKKIIIASPWITDLENPVHRISSPLLAGVETKVKRKLKNLGDLLIHLAKHYDVYVVTSEPNCSRWKSNWDEISVDRDRTFQKKLQKRGVHIIHKVESHVKLISTPICHLSGSANITNNGFFNNVETMNIQKRHESGFGQSRQIAQRLANLL
jgi:hypothetical protein